MKFEPFWRRTDLMMAEALLKNPVCSKCGEVARPQAQFCFACGGKIIERHPEHEVSSVWFRSDLTEDSSTSDEQPEAPSVADETPEAEAPSVADETPEAEAPSVVDETPEVEAPSVADETPEAEAPSVADETPEVEAPSVADETPEADAPADSGESEKAPGKSQVKIKSRDFSSIPPGKPFAKGRLASAAELRKRPRPVYSKRVEVIWKEKTDSPNLLFVVCGLGLAFLVAILFFASLYLR